MEININDAARCASTSRIATGGPSLNLICAQLPRSSAPRVLPRPSRSRRQANARRSRRFYLYAPQASRVSAASRREEEKKKPRRTREGGEGDTHSIAHRCTAESAARNSFRILYPARAGASHSAWRFPLCVSGVHARPIHPRGATVTWIISIFAPAKVSRRDYCGATRFHPREKRRGRRVRRPDCDATTSLKYHGKQGPL